MKKPPLEAPQMPNLGKLALIGPYQLALADWHAARKAIANSQDS